MSILHLILCKRVCREQKWRFAERRIRREQNVGERHSFVERRRFDSRALDPAPAINSSMEHEDDK